MGYISNLDNHILPRWGDHHPERVAAIEIEEWLKSLPLAPTSRAKVRNVFSMIFRHAIRWGWLDRNPVMMVRVSSKRLRRPDVLTAEEFRALLAGLADMRHAKISTTMEVYAQAGMEKKRLAQRRAVDVVGSEAEELFRGAVKNGVVPDRSREIANAPRSCRLTC
jgi:site-specific recombinase XerD